MADEIAIKVDHVSKDFVLPHEKISSVKSAFTSLYRKKSKTRETQHALKDISFEVKKGEFFGIVGRNGSGKSTMLKILANIYQPTKGSVRTDGKLVPFIELGVGFNPELTGRENVYLNGAMLGFSRKEITAMYDDIVAFAELERFMDQKLKNYSSGMQVRLAFSMATRSEADILLVDEVLAVGDAAFQRKCFDYFLRLKGSDTTVIFITHDMNAIREYCDRAMLIDNNRTIAIGSPDSIAQDYSRMFIEASSQQNNTAEKSKRWGTGAAAYNRASLNSEALSTEKELVISTEVTTTKDMDGLIVGFMIKNSAGQILAGTNNVLEDQPLSKLRNNQKLKLKWTIPNIFSDGYYSVDLAAVEKNGEECDWWESALNFKVLRAREHAPYVVSPPIKLNVDIDDK
jgi:ABC-2 type transport system ATP-binding protein